MRGSPFSSPGSSPLGQLREAYSSAHEASSVGEPSLVSSHCPLGTSSPASPCFLLWSLAKKAQHKQKSDQGATEQGSLECEAASAGPKANRGIFWPHTVRRCVCSPASPVQPRISISLEVASQSPLFLPAYAAVKRFPTLLGRVGMQVFIGKNVIWCLLFNFSSHCQHLQVSLFILCCCPPG